MENKKIEVSPKNVLTRTVFQTVLKSVTMSVVDGKPEMVENKPLTLTTGRTLSDNTINKELTGNFGTGTVLTEKDVKGKKYSFDFDEIIKQAFKVEDVDVKDVKDTEK